MDQTKPFYSIGQVAEYFELPQSVLRYWESVFDALHPAKSPGGSRQYSDSDLKVITDIRHLLYERGFTIRGANKILNKKYKIPLIPKQQEEHKSEQPKNSKKSEEKPLQNRTDSEKNKFLIKKIIKELNEIIKVLDK